MYNFSCITGQLVVNGITKELCLRKGASVTDKVTKTNKNYIELLIIEDVIVTELLSSKYIEGEVYLQLVDRNQFTSVLRIE